MYLFIKNLFLFFLKSLYKTYQLVTVSFVFSLLIFSLYLSEIPFYKQIYSWLYITTIPLYYYFILLIASFLISTICFVTFSKYLIFILKSLFDIYLLVNFFVFKLYHFHINSIFINMFIFDFKGFGFSNFIITLFILIVLLIIIVNILIFKWVDKKTPPLFYTGAITLFLFLLGQMLHIWANEYKRVEIISYTPYFPFYSPTTSYNTMHALEDKYPNYFPSSSSASDKISLSLNTSSSQLNYPKKNIQLTPSLKSRPNILFIVFESWRADSLTASITPHINEFSKKSHYFKNHISNGNVTKSGLFSLMTGLYPNYWHYIKSNPNSFPSQFTKTLFNRDYNLEVYTSYSLDRFQLRSIFFSDVKKFNYHEFLDHSEIINDQELTDAVVQSLKSETKKPWFKFLFYSSSHHSYDYPDRYKRFTPVPKNAEAYILNPQTDSKPYLNDYHNSLYFSDDLFQKIISELKQHKDFDNTLIVLTSDHGEEFNDNQIGHWGHGSNFTLAQIAVPLLIKLPQQKKGVTYNKRTYHVDISTTILQDTLGVLNPIKDYSSGMNLFDKKTSRLSVLKNYIFTAYVIDNTIYQTNPHVFSYDISNLNKKNTNFQYSLLRKITSESNYFLQ